MALEADNTVILETLCEKIKLSESPQLLHEFKSKIFDDRYKSVLLTLIKRESSHELTTEKLDTLDAEGFTPFLAYVTAFIDQRTSLMTAIGNELNYQEYLHKDRVANYNITNLDIFKSRHAKDKAYGEFQRTASSKFFLDATKKLELHKKFFHTLIAQPFVNFLVELIEQGVNPHARVEKLEFYRKLDEHKKHLVLLGDQRNANAAADVLMNEEQKAGNVSMIDTSGPRQAESN